MISNSQFELRALFADFDQVTGSSMPLGLSLAQDIERRGRRILF